MASFESLSDGELREKLLEYGYDLPISINRDFLLRKLVSVAGTAKKVGGVNQRKSSGRTRSVEKDALESRQLAAKAKTRFSLAHDFQFQPEGIDEENENGIEDFSVEQNSSQFLGTRPTRTPSNVLNVAPPNNDERSDSASVCGRRKERYSNYLNLFRTGRIQNTQQSPMYSSKNFSEDESEEETTELSSSQAKRVGGLLNPFNWGKKTRNERNAHFDPPSQLGIARSASFRPSGLSQSPSKNGHASTSYFQGRSAPSGRYQLDEAKTDSPNISKILVFVLVLFFSVIGGCYYYKGRSLSDTQSPGENVEEGSEASKYMNIMGGNFPICGLDGVDPASCIRKETAKACREVFLELKRELVQRSQLKSCGSDVDHKISLESAKTLVTRLSDLTRVATDEVFRGMLYLCAENPKWGLVIESDEGNAIVNYLDVDKLDLNTATIMAVNVQQTWFCYIFQSAKAALNYLVLVVLAVGILIACGKGWLYYRDLKKAEEKEMFDMIEQILELLYQHFEKSKESGETPFLAVNHIRDELVPPKERQSKAALWIKVADYISSNESRIREEMQHISGEEYKVWRWLPSASPSISQRKSLSPTSLPAHLPNLTAIDAENKWQGQAFEMSDGSPNALPTVTPTTCLKIRQMFDATMTNAGAGPEIYDKIESTILEKCPDAAILHIGLDPSSPEGCVYVKCATKEDARKAYMALHGWWFDGHLLSVKFLREERYLTRFPEVRDRKSRLTPRVTIPKNLGARARGGNNGGISTGYVRNANQSF